MPQRAIGAEEIVDRCIYALVNEGAKILEEGYALRAGDIDIIYVNGYGFPAHRGGPMWYADTVGLKKVLARVEEFEKQHGELWTPAPLLRRLAEEGKTFAEFGADGCVTRGVAPAVCCGILVSDEPAVFRATRASVISCGELRQTLAARRETSDIAG